MDLIPRLEEPLSVALLRAEADVAHAEELLKQFAAVGSAVSVWHPGLIGAGELARQRGDEAVESAAVVVALLSSDLLSDSTCARWLELATEQQEMARGRLIPVRLRPIAEEPHGLRGLQMLPRSGKPLAGRPEPEREQILAELVQEVLRLGDASGRTAEDRTLFDDVLRFCRLDHEASGARIEQREKRVGPPLGHLAELIAVKPGKPKQALLLAAFAGTPSDVHLSALRPWNQAHRKRHPFAISVLVYDGPAPSDELVNAAYEEGIHVVGFAEHQRLIDVDPYIDRLLARLARDPLYPPSLYVTQRAEWLRGDSPPMSDVLATLEETLITREQRFVVVLGDFGAGKTFLLKRLAARLGLRRRPPYPVLIEMRLLEKVHSIEALAAQHFAMEGRPFFPESFRAMLHAAQIALLFDGFDELALRVRYARAAEHLEMLIAAADGNAKMVLTSRTQHFASDQQVRTALAERADRVAGREVIKLMSFDQEQIERFLQNKLVDVAQASARVRLLDHVKDLLGLSANPRMLSFIAELPEAELLKACDRNQEITAASLYRRLLDYWFDQEDERLRFHNDADKLRSEERWQAVEALALRLWGRTERLLNIAKLPEEVGRVLGNLSARDLDKEMAGHLVGSGTLLVREGDGQFSFLHQSVMEWLVANAAADILKAGGTPGMLEKGEMSPLMADFFIDLTPPGRAVGWARGVVQGLAPDSAKRNALLVLRRAGVEAKWANYRDKDLRGQDFSRQDLAGADFSGADLSEARFSEAILATATLRDTKLINANLERATLTDADLTGADLSYARLTGANLSGAKIERASFYRTKLAGAQLGSPVVVIGQGDRHGGLFSQADVQPIIDVPASACAAIGVTKDLLASGHEDGNIQLWDHTAGVLLRSLGVDPHPVQSVAFSADGLMLAAGSAEGAISVWDIASGRLLHTMRRHSGSANCVAFSSSMALLASGFADNTFCIWEVSSGRLLHSIRGHSAGVNSISFSPDDTTLASGAGDNLIGLWDTTSWTLRGHLTGHTDSINSVAFSSDGLRLVSGSSDATIRIWNPQTGKVVTVLTWKEHEPRASSKHREKVYFDASFALTYLNSPSPRAQNQASDSSLRDSPQHEYPITSVAVEPRSGAIASSSITSRVRVWNSSGELSRTLRGHTAPVRATAYTPDGLILASGSDDKTVRIWQMSTGNYVRTLEGHSNWALGVAFSPDGNILASGSGDHTIARWSTSSGRLLTYSRSHSGAVIGVDFSPDGSLLASGSADATVRLWSSDESSKSVVLQGHSGPVRSVKFSPDGRTLASSSDDQTIRIWDCASNRPLQALSGHSHLVRSVAFGPDGLMLASGSDDKTVRLWECSTGSPLSRFDEHSSRVRSVTFSPDGRRIVSGSDDHLVRIWDPTAGKMISSLKGHRASVNTVAFSPDGRTLVSCSDDRSVRLWDATTFEPLRSLEGHGNWVLSVTFHPSGRYLAAACADGSLHLWSVAEASRVAVLWRVAHGWVAYRPDGRYKCGGDLRGSFWHVIGLCRYEIGELDSHIPGIRMADGESLVALG